MSLRQHLNLEAPPGTVWTMQPGPVVPTSGGWYPSLLLFRSDEPSVVFRQDAFGNITLDGEPFHANPNTYLNQKKT